MGFILGESPVFLFRVAGLDLAAGSTIVLSFFFCYPLLEKQTVPFCVYARKQQIMILNLQMVIKYNHL